MDFFKKIILTAMKDSKTSAKDKVIVSSTVLNGEDPGTIPPADDINPLADDINE